MPQIQRQTSGKIRFGTSSIPQVESFDVLNVSGVGQGLPTLLEREGALLVLVPHLLAIGECSSWVGADPAERLFLVHPSSCRGQPSL